MANNDLVRRPSNSSTSYLIPHETEVRKSTLSEKNIVYSLNFIWPFSIPSTPESAAARIIRNLGYFAMYYAQFMWIVLFITLIPERKVSLTYLAIMKEIIILYFMLLHAVPNSVLFHKIIDKRVVMVLLSVIIGVEMILTRAGIHLVASLAGTIPLILMHAVFWRNEENNTGTGGGGGEELGQFVNYNIDGGGDEVKPLDLV